MHGICGLWGLLAVGIFDKDDGILNSGSTDLLKLQIGGGLILIAWSSLVCGTFFKIMKSIGRFRVPYVYEVIGIDLMMHQSIDELRHHPILQNTTTSPSAPKKLNNEDEQSDGKKHKPKEWEKYINHHER